MTCDSVENVAMHAHLWSDSDDVKLKIMNYFYSHREFFTINLLPLKNEDLIFLKSLSAPYIKQCRSADPELVTCLKGALHHLRPWLKSGIPEIQVKKSQFLSKVIPSQ